MSKNRLERDLLGEMELPEDAYYGIQTARAIENFPITVPSIINSRKISNGRR